MWQKIEDFFFDKMAGKLLARAGITLASYLASAPIQGALAKAGLHATIDPAEFSAGAIALGHAAYEWYKNWRKKPEASAAPVSAA